MRSRVLQRLGGRLAKHDVVKGVDACRSTDKALNGRERAVHEDLAALGSMGERELFAGAEERHGVRARYRAATQRMHANLGRLARAAHALAPEDRMPGGICGLFGPVSPITELAAEDPF